MQLKLYTDVLRAVHTTQALEKYAAASGDEDALQLKAQTACHVLERLKTAGIGELAKGALKSPLGKGLMYGTGAAIPATAGGAYLLHRGGEEAKGVSEDLRNKALQTALGVGAVGAGLYGMHRLTKPTKLESVNWQYDPRTGERVPFSGYTAKQGSALEPAQTLIEKLATVGFLDEVFANQEKTATQNAQQDAHECRLLNAEHGLDILSQLLSA